MKELNGQEMRQTTDSTICNPSNFIVRGHETLQMMVTAKPRGIGQEASSIRGNSGSESPLDSRQLDWTWIGRGLDTNGFTDSQGSVVSFATRDCYESNYYAFLFNIYSVTDSWIIVQKNGFVRDGVVD